MDALIPASHVIVMYVHHSLQIALEPIQTLTPILDNPP